MAGNIAGSVGYLNQRGLVNTVKSFDDTGTLASSFRDLSRPCCVYLIKPGPATQRISEFAAEFDEFKGLFTVLQCAGACYINKDYVDIIQLPIIETYKNYLIFPISSYSKDTKMGGINPADVDSIIQNETMSWRKVVGDVVSVSVSNSVSRASTANVTIRNPNRKYVYKGLLPAGSTYLDYPDILAKKETCVFGTDDIIIIALPDMNDRINIVFTGYVNSVTDYTASADNSITLFCEDITKKLRFTRTCVKKSFLDKDPDVLKAPLYSFTVPWVDGSVGVAKTSAVSSIPAGIQLILDLLSWSYVTDINNYRIHKNYETRNRNIENEKLSKTRVSDSVKDADAELKVIQAMRQEAIARVRQLCVDNDSLYDSLEEKSRGSGTNSLNFGINMASDESFVTNMWNSPVSFSDGTTTYGVISDWMKSKGINLDMAAVKAQVQVLTDLITAQGSLITKLAEEASRDAKTVRAETISDFEAELENLRTEHQKIGNGVYFVYKDSIGGMGRFPVAIMSDTDHEAFQFVFSDNNGIGQQISEWEENGKLINKFIGELNWDFFADEIGVIHIRPPYAELKAKHDLNYIITNDKIKSCSLTDDNTDIITSIYVTGADIWDVVNTSDLLGMAGFYSDNRMIEKYGYGKIERKHVLSLLSPEACSRYAHMYLERYNRTRSETGTLEMVGDSSIRIGNWVYIPLKNCLAYVSGISHSFANNSYSCSLSLEYVRHPIGELPMSLETTKSRLRSLGYSETVIDTIDSEVFSDDMCFDGYVWEPVAPIDWKKAKDNISSDTYNDIIKTVKERIEQVRGYIYSETDEISANMQNPDKRMDPYPLWDSQQALMDAIIATGKSHDINQYIGKVGELP